MTNAYWDLHRKLSDTGWGSTVVGKDKKRTLKTLGGTLPYTVQIITLVWWPPHPCPCITQCLCGGFTAYLIQTAVSTEWRTAMESNVLDKKGEAAQMMQDRPDVKHPVLAHLPIHVINFFNIYDKKNSWAASPWGLPGWINVDICGFWFSDWFLLVWGKTRNFWAKWRGEDLGKIEEDNQEISGNLSCQDPFLSLDSLEGRGWTSSTCPPLCSYIGISLRNKW